jgi:hypothetical protein
LASVLTQIEQEGVHLRPLPTGDVQVKPLASLTPELRAVLAANRAVLWRLLEMRRLAVEAPRAVPYVRESACGGPGQCFSCGDPLERADAYGRCGPCDAALELFYTTRHPGEIPLLSDDDVVARSAVFRQQLEATPPPAVPAFLFKAGIPYTPAVCFSCGEPNGRTTFGRCWRCSVAWRLECRLPIQADVATALDSAKVA